MSQTDTGLSSQQNTTRQIKNKYDKQRILQQISQTFLPRLSPHHFISYSTFKKYFQINSSNYEQQNRNIIDIHLRFRQFIFEQMMPYKWTPILVYALTQVFRLKTPAFVLPALYLMAFDYYFQPFFIWLNSSEPIINIRRQFVTKLSKQEYINRRIKLYQNLGQLKINNEVPKKYIKFGQWTPFIFHTTINQCQQSSSYLTSFFRNYIYIRHFSLQSLIRWKEHLQFMWKKFKQFRQFSLKQRKNILLIEDNDIKKLLSHSSISNNQIFSIQKPSSLIKMRIQRFLQVMNYEKSGEFGKSEFNFQSATHLTKHYHLVDWKQKYGVQSNIGDLAIYYSIIAIPFIIKKIIKRA